MWMRKILTEPLYVIMWNSSGRRSSIGYVYVGTKIFAQPADEGHYVLIIFTTTTNVAIEEPHLESFSCLPPSIIIHEMSSCFGIVQLSEGRKSMRIYCSVCLFALLLIIFIRNNGNRIRSRLLVQGLGNLAPTNARIVAKLNPKRRTQEESEYAVYVCTFALLIKGRIL